VPPTEHFVTEETLRKAYEQPAAGLPEFLKHILGLAHLPTPEERINNAFEQFISEHGYLLDAIPRAIRHSHYNDRRGVSGTGG